MNVNVHVSSETTAPQYVALSNFFRELSCVPAAASQPPVDPADLTEPEVVVAGTVVTESTPAVVKRRRTKAEIAADEGAAKVVVEVEQLGAEGSKVAAAEAAAQASNEAELAMIEAQATNKAELAELAEIKAAEEAKVDDFEKAAAVTGGKTFTEAEAQLLATVVARTKGPTVVKDKIAELGATRIGDLTADKLNELGNFLETQK